MYSQICGCNYRIQWLYRKERNILWYDCHFKQVSGYLWGYQGVDGRQQSQFELCYISWNVQSRRSREENAGVRGCMRKRSHWVGGVTEVQQKSMGRAEAPCASGDGRTRNCRRAEALWGDTATGGRSRAGSLPTLMLRLISSYSKNQKHIEEYLSFSYQKCSSL